MEAILSEWRLTNPFAKDVSVGHGGDRDSDVDHPDVIAFRPTTCSFRAPTTIRFLFFAAIVMVKLLSIGT